MSELPNWANNKNKYDRAVSASYGGSEDAVLKEYRLLGGKVNEEFVPVKEVKKPLGRPKKDETTIVAPKTEEVKPKE